MNPCLDDSVVFKIYKDISYINSIVESDSLSDRLKVYKIQASFIRKNILGLMYTDNKSAKNIKQGYVYAISNPSWGDYVKIGCTIDVYDRLRTYQSYSPFRDYELIGYVYSDNKLELEREIHSKFERNGEWILTDRSTIKRFLKDHEQFDLSEISKYSLNEVCRVIGQSAIIKTQDSDRNKVKTFLKYLRAKVHNHFDYFNNIDINSRNSVSSKNRIWNLVGTPLFMQVVDNAVVAEIKVDNLP